MVGVYKKREKIKYKNQLFQIIERKDKKLGFLKIVVDGEKTEYEYPTAYEFLHLSSFMNKKNRIKFWFSLIVWKYSLIIYHSFLSLP